MKPFSWNFFSNLRVGLRYGATSCFGMRQKVVTVTIAWGIQLPGEAKHVKVCVFCSLIMKGLVKLQISDYIKCWWRCVDTQGLLYIFDRRVSWKDYLIKLNNPATALLLYRQETFLLVYNTRHVKDDDSSIVQIAKRALSPNVYRQESRWINWGIVTTWMKHGDTPEYGWILVIWYLMTKVSQGAHTREPFL